MCYRCGVCDRVVPPNSPRKVHVEYRHKAANKVVTVLERGNRVRPRPRYQNVTYQRREIVHETPVCPDCHHRLNEGMSKIHLQQQTVEEKRKRDQQARLLTLPVRKGRLAAPLPCGDESAAG